MGGNREQEVTRMVAAEGGKGRTGATGQSDGSWMVTWALRFTCISDFPTQQPQISHPVIEFFCCYLMFRPISLRCPG